MKKQIAILGSTGSIGTQALEVIREHSDLYEVYCLTANNKVELLAEQAHQFKPAAVVIANEQRYDELKQLMSDMPEVKVYAGAKALDEEGYPQGSSLWHWFCHLGYLSHREKGRVWRNLRWLMDSRYLSRLYVKFFHRIMKS